MMARHNNNGVHFYYFHDNDVISIAIVQDSMLRMRIEPIIIKKMVQVDSRGGTKSLIFHVTFVHTNARHHGRVPIWSLC